MNTTRYIAALTAAAAVAAAAPAYAAEGAPPLKGGVHCHHVLKKRYRLSSVVKHGMPIKIVCDGPARFIDVPEFMAMTPQMRELTRIGGHSLPYVSSVKETGMSQAGTVTVRPRLTKVAVRVMRHYKRTKMKVGLGTLREDGYLWSDPGDWGHTVVVR
jgi:hypothetical protein